VRRIQQEKREAQMAALEKWKGWVGGFVIWLFGAVPVREVPPAQNPPVSEAGIKSRQFRLKEDTGCER
jgi:hypothetical protein